MAPKKRGVSRLDTIRNENGAVLAGAIILLFFVTLFLFSIVSWHDSLYRIFDSLEMYYENETIRTMNRDD